MKIGVMGCEFESPNKGCEALSYSFVSVLKRLELKDINIINFTGTKLGIIEEIFPEIKFENVFPKIKDFKFRYIKKLRECDFIFDVTMGDSFSDIYSFNYFKSLCRHKLIAEHCCNKYILLPQTYGPFYKKISNKYANEIFSKAYKIYCRDEISQKLLKDKFNIESELTTDMAFLLPYNKSEYNIEKNKKTKIGINVSGLLYKGGFNGKNQFELKLDYKNYIDI